MKIFNCLKITEENQNIYISRNNVPPTLVYSKRSIKREKEHLNEIIEKNTKSITLYVAPFYESFFESLAKFSLEKFYWLSPNPAKQKANNLIDNSDLWKKFLFELKGNEKISIIFHPIILRIDLKKMFEAELNFELKEAARRLKTIKHFEKIWKYNFKRNSINWEKNKDISELDINAPDVIVLGGLSANKFIANNLKNCVVWCVDTALSPLLHAGFKPDLVFSIDAGRGSFEHFYYYNENQHQIRLVLDRLSFPHLFQYDRTDIYSYVSSNPLFNMYSNKATLLINDGGDVTGLINKILQIFFKKDISHFKVYGQDGASPTGISHLRGSGYHYYHSLICNRLNTRENYFRKLNNSYKN